jgi:uroporphyrinogen III methyltransferase/synthase
MKKGKVYLVGAGPGEPTLLTIKALKLIKEADIVLYDKLVGVQILDMIRWDAEKIDVGKFPDYHKVSQGEINQRILEEAQKGKVVVRLKGGDPFLFGRGGEELELLVQHGIPFEVVPGISSAIAVPAYCGIPVTHREAASSLHIFTGHSREGKELNIPYKSAVMSGGTLVFLMGVSAITEICQGLLLEGMNGEKPAAIIQQGTTCKQKKIVATLETLPKMAEEAGIKNPAIIIIGEVCAYSEKFEWVTKKPLFGKRIVVTRPKEVSSTLSERIRELGGEALEFPSIETKEIPLPHDFEDIWERLDEYTWLIFTSAYGVKTTFKKMRDAKKDARSLKGIAIASIGPGTTRALRDFCLEPDYMPTSYDVKHLANGLIPLIKKDDRILLLRAEEGSRAINRIFDHAGIRYSDIPLYETLRTKGEGSFSRELISTGQFDVAAFTSASTVQGFTTAFPDMDFSKVQAVCIGRETAAEAEKYNMHTYIAEESTIESLVEAIIIMEGEQNYE